MTRKRPHTLSHPLRHVSTRAIHLGTSCLRMCTDAHLSSSRGRYRLPEHRDWCFHTVIFTAEATYRRVRLDWMLNHRCLAVLTGPAAVVACSAHVTRISPVMHASSSLKAQCALALFTRNLALCHLSMCKQQLTKLKLTIGGGARQPRAAAALVARVPHGQARRQLQFCKEELQDCGSASTRGCQVPGCYEQMMLKAMLEQVAARHSPHLAVLLACTFAGRV
jgi:hypothetical protein